MKSWINVSETSDFSIYNIPFGIYSCGNSGPRVASAIGEYVLDLSSLYQLGLLTGPFGLNDFQQSHLNALMKYGKSTMVDLRLQIQQLLLEGNDQLQSHASREEVLIPMQTVTMHLPVQIGDYTDFYSSIDHARNVGMMFRDPAKALLPNWKHLPVGYHGRSSTILPSGVPIKRPLGQTNASDETLPQFGPSQQLDFELEMAFITLDGKPMGERITTAEAKDYILGFVVFNDWSARDIQRWEYVPLGPFLAKNFASTISPWVVTLEALAPFHVAGEKQDPPVLPYLEFSGNYNVDIQLEVSIQPQDGADHVVTRSNYKHMYWNYAQQLAHHTVGGCWIRSGDMMASGTISGPQEGSYGSMLEIAWKGTKPVQMPDGSQRKFIQDGDTVKIKAFAQGDHYRVGFGPCEARVLPADQLD
jgi:fumarylacetoacetase